MSTVRKFFVGSMIVSIIIRLFPPDEFIEMYTPSVLGYIWILSILLVFACYLVLVLNKSRSKKNKRRDSLLLCIFILAKVLLWIILASIKEIIYWKWFKRNSLSYIKERLFKHLVKIFKRLSYNKNRGILWWNS